MKKINYFTTQASFIGSQIPPTKDILLAHSSWLTDLQQRFWASGSLIRHTLSVLSQHPPRSIQVSTSLKYQSKIGFTEKTTTDITANPIKTFFIFIGRKIKKAFQSCLVISSNVAQHNPYEALFRAGRCLARKVSLLGFSAFCAFAIVQSFAFTADARDLVDAAQTAQTMFNRIGIAAISIGITLGGILFALGAAQIGRMLLISGAIGAVAILGAPAIINLLGRVFGAGL